MKEVKQPVGPYAKEISKYEAQMNRHKKRFARKLLKLEYPGLTLTFTGDDCELGDAPGKSVQDYASNVCTHVSAETWLKLPKADRYDALNLLIPQEYHTPVKGGMVYQVRFKAKKVAEEWVFLHVGHAIGRCKLVATTLGARVL